MLESKKIMRVCFPILLSLFFLSNFSSSVHAENNSKISEMGPKAQAYAYDPANPQKVIVLAQNTEVPAGWEIFVVTGNLMILLTSGASMTLVEGNFYRADSGIQVEVPANVQNVVAAAIAQLQSTPSGANSPVLNPTEEAAQPATVDDPLRAEDRQGS